MNAVAQEKFSAESLRNPHNHKELFDNALPINEVPIYRYEFEDSTLLFENGYASPMIVNADEWPPQGLQVIPTQVKVIFTKYPKDNDFWLTDYHWLLAKRLENLFSIDPRFNDLAVEFKIVLQNDCENEPEAMQLFHGIEVHYKKAPEKKELLPQIALNQGYDKDLNRWMSQPHAKSDSVVYKALARNPQWKNATVVIDWTGGMYAHGAEALLWHHQHSKVSGIKRFVFFNDGNGLSNKKKVPGYTGGIYMEDAAKLQHNEKLLHKIKRKGDGGDSPENDIEALISAINAAPEALDIVLIADNRSCIRDYPLISCIDRPIHIILVGAEPGVNHQYLNLAWKTGGSLHTAYSDITNINSQITKGEIVIDEHRFLLTPDYLLMPADRSGSELNICRKYYHFSNRTVISKKHREPKCYFTN